MAADLLASARRPFLKFAASSDPLLYGSTIFADHNASVALEWIGGLRFLLSLGVRNVLSLEDSATAAAAATHATTFSNDNDRVFQQQRHGLQPPNSTANTKHTAIFFITSEVWHVEEQILQILSDTRAKTEGSFDRALICCSLSEEAHASSSSRPNMWYETTFMYKRYKQDFKSLLLKRLKEHTPPSCLLSIRHFPLVMNVVLDSRIKGRGAHANMGVTKCLGLFTLTNESSRSIFPTTPCRLSSNDRAATSGSLSRVTIDYLPISARSTLKMAAHQLVDVLELLGLQVTSGGYAIGHDHSAVAFGETVLSVASEKSLMNSSNEDVSIRSASLIVIDRTMDVVGPSSKEGRTWLDKFSWNTSKNNSSTSSNSGKSDRRRQRWEIANTFAHANNPKTSDLARSLMLLDPGRSKAMTMQTIHRIIRSLSEETKNDSSSRNENHSVEASVRKLSELMQKSNSTADTRTTGRWLIDIALKMQKSNDRCNEEAVQLKLMKSMERMQRQCLLDPDFGLVEIIDQLCALLVKTWWRENKTDESGIGQKIEKEDSNNAIPFQLNYRDIMVLLIQLFGYKHSEEMDASCIKKLRIHMAAALLNGNRTNLSDLCWLPVSFIDQVLAWQPKRRIPDLVISTEAKAKNGTSKKETGMNQDDVVVDDDWGSDDGWGSDDDDLLGSESEEDSEVKAAKEAAAADSTRRKQEQERMLRVHTEDLTGMRLQAQADAMINEMLSRLFELSTSREKLLHFKHLLSSTDDDGSGSGDEDINLHLIDQGSKRNDYVPLLSQMCRHVFELYTSEEETELSDDFITLADYSVASTIKSVGELASSTFSSFFGGGTSTTKSTSNKNHSLGSSSSNEDTTLVFFVLGGVTSFEISQIHRIMEETGMSNYGDVLVGSTKLLTDVKNDCWNNIFMEPAE